MSQAMTRHRRGGHKPVRQARQGLSSRVSEQGLSLSSAHPRNAAICLLGIVAAVCLAIAVPAGADITVNVAAPGGAVTQALPDAGGAFSVDIPLNKNTVNSITVSAEDTVGNTAEQLLAVTQVSLADVVISEFTSERLPPERIEQLVNDGVIDLDDPENYNVSEFSIVLTIDTRPVTISVPIVMPIGDNDGGWENIRLPWGDDASSDRPKPPPVEIVVFEKPVPSLPGEPAPPPIPGVLIIEGRIKSLKEFFSCRLILMNASGIFTLSDVIAELDFPDGGLTNILPADGLVSFGDILPGDGGQPGQVEKEFIIRGDEIGVRGVTVNFGGHVTGPGIPEDEPIPFNGSAETDVEVKGPPSFEVQVFHPVDVEAGQEYDMRVNVTNTGDLPALYASLEIDMGSDGELVECDYDEVAKQGECQTVEGPVVRSLGHVYPGDTVSETFTVRSKQSGFISSCMAAADQNISLQVYVGTLGCNVGQYPPDDEAPDGIPTVRVLPVPNALSISTDAPVVAFFSELMNQETITTGEDGTFNVFDSSGALLPGTMSFDTLGETTDHERTVAVWQFEDGVTNRLAANTEFTAMLTQDITDYFGNGLYSEWTSTFTTTGEGVADDDPPTVTMSVEPPVDANYVLPGEIVRVNAYASDAGSGVARVEARIKDLDDAEAVYKLIDIKSVAVGDMPPYIFSIDSANLVFGHAYQIMATAYDFVGNAQNATIGIIVADSADPPTVTLPDDPPLPSLQGISVQVTPVAFTGAVREIRYYLDGAAEPFNTATLRPYQAFLRTLELGLGEHTVRAVAVDGLGQSGEDTLTIDLIENVNMPVVDFGSGVDGAQYVIGSSFVVNINVEDPVGIASVEAFIDSAKDDPVTTGTSSFVIHTDDLGLGDHRITVVATNRLGVSNDPTAPDSILEFAVVEPPPGEPPAAPAVTDVSYPEDGLVTVQGTTVPNARVDVTNTTLGISVSVYAEDVGTFTAVIEADAGDELRLVAYDFSESPDPSQPTVATVEAAPVLDHIEATPETMTFTSFDASHDVVVTAYYEGGATADVTAQAIFSSSAPGVAGVNAAGRVAPIGNGDAAITVEVDGHTDEVAVNVNVLVLTHITVDPSPVSLVAIAETQQLAVTAHYSDDSSHVVSTGVSYVSGNAAVATVNSSGQVTAVADGLTHVTVYLPRAEPVDVPVSVNTGADPPPTVEITSPGDGTMVERGQTASVSVQADDALGGVSKIYFDVTGATVYSTIRQIAPPALSTLQSFDFQVSDSAALGGTITVSAYAEDTSGGLSEIDAITLVVGDETPPAVTIDQPAQLAEFNFGDMIAIEITATDAVGVSQIRYVATGAIEGSGTRTIDPATPTANASFNLPVPFGLIWPDLRIDAYATDTEGNEGQAVPVDVIITDADITPPETIATAVTQPGQATHRTVAYEVLDGVADLDHVELFFRRDGYGTFNRYTRPDAGNPNGHFTPQNGDSGWVVFNSTCMGGDGHYDFYTVGVDVAGNREPAPEELVPGGGEGEGEGEWVVVPDQEATIAAGTVWAVIDVETTLGVGDTTYDDRNVRIDGVTVTMSGHHAFQNVELVNGAVLTHPETDTENEYALDLEAWTLTIDAASAINVNARGYLGGLHNNGDSFGRTFGNVAGSTYRSAGSYGGVGAAYDGAPNEPYGNLVTPAELGSGGSQGNHGGVGGDGGGRGQVQAINVVVDGGIAANGGAGGSYQAGSGSGGAIYLVVATLSGQGTLTTNGGAGEVGGGGGRVAVHYIDLSTMDTGLIRSVGGQGSAALGGNGTVFLKGVDEGSGTLVVDGQGVASAFSTLPIPPGYVFDNIIIRNSARVVADDLLEVNDTLSVLTNSIVTHSLSSEDGLQIEADHVYVDDTSSIDVSIRGYRGGGRDGNGNSYGLTLGGLPGAQYQSGGSYGGYGGVFSGSGSNPPYGHAADAVYLGSGGSQGNHGGLGGNGGGRIDIIARKGLEVDGAVLANGGTGTGYQAGSGSGGSIRIAASLLKGTGRIAADAGAGETGGGGGRVAVTYDYAGFEGDDLDGLRAISAFGGHGSNAWGSAGTVLMRRRDQDLGDLYIDDNMTDETSSVYTPLTLIAFGTIQDLTDDTLTTDGKVRMIPNGLVGVEINPNTSQDQTFDIVSNTENTITVDTTAKVLLTAVASVGDTYVGVHRFDNVFFRRGGFLVLGDRLVVSDTMLIDEYGRLTHYDASTSWESRLDLEAGALEIAETASINVNARGYLGGLHNGAGSAGRNDGNVDGSTYRSAGSYGGLGARYEGTPNAVYGSVTDPAALGSGGSQGNHGGVGGDGGGWAAIQADTMQVDGVISANGGDGGSYEAGSGSGGTIRVTTSSLAGGGFIRSNGGAGQTGGGGGRIALYYETMTFDEGHFEALGGQGTDGRIGGNGTLFLKRPAETWGTLAIDGLGQSTPAGSSRIPQGYTFDNIILRNSARVVADDPITVVDALRLETNSALTHTRGSEAGLSIEAGRVLVDATSSIDASAKGYAGGGNGNSNSYGTTLGGLAGAQYRSGGTYGGYGAVYSGSGSNSPYGHPSDPAYLGSGGSQGDYAGVGGHGGGRLHIVAQTSVDIHGSVLANGGNGGSYGAGSGSGGSILIETSELRGAGTIAANGGAGETGGGGGRVAVVYDSVAGPGDDLEGLRNVSAFGGRGSAYVGSAGTVLLRRTDQTYGDLYIDDNVADATSSVYTPLTPITFGTIAALSDDTLATDGLVRMISNGLAGIEINPNTAQDETFTIVSNTEDTITVDTAAKVPLTSVASVGDTYVGVYRFDNVYFRRGGFLVMGDRLIVSDTMLIDEFGRLTHYDATATYESHLDLSVGTLQITDTSSINVGARGYLGGLRGGIGASGRTLGNVDGATYRSGGSFGGLGGAYDGTPNPAYGDPLHPAALGSGGSQGNYGATGGDGGGWVAIEADSVFVDGAISADGGSGGSYAAGSGSGGTVAIDTGHLAGVGWIRANGGVGEVGGGGGRIAIDYATLGGTGDDLGGLRNIAAFGGHPGSYWGSAGTVVLRQSGQARGDLYVDDNIVDGDGVPNGTSSRWTPLTHIGFGGIADVTPDTLATDGLVPMTPAGLVGLEINPNIAQDETYTIISNTADTITVDVTAKPVLTSVADIGDTYVGIHRFNNVYFRRGGFLVMGDRLSVSGTMSIDEFGRLTHYDADTVFESRLELTVADLAVAATASINATARGYLGGLHGNGDSFGRTLGNVAGSTYRSAGSFGGLGGSYGGTPNAVYGNAEQPAALGSGGSQGNHGALGGDGGGWIWIHAGAMAVDGTITCNGGGGGGYQAGSGSGGAIYLATPSLTGAGAIQANGGGSELGGGGGRVAVYYDDTASDVDALAITAGGGDGSNADGQDGSVYTETGPVAAPEF